MFFRRKIYFLKFLLIVKNGYKQSNCYENYMGMLLDALFLNIFKPFNFLKKGKIGLPVVHRDPITFPREESGVHLGFEGFKM